MKSMFESAWMRMRLKYNGLYSGCAFNLYLRRYTKAVDHFRSTVVGRCMLTPG